MRRLLALGLVAAFGGVGIGCAPVEYVGQAGCGQLDLGLRTEPIERVLAEKHAPAEVRRLLAEVPAIKRFAEKSGLTPTKSYRSYAEVHRAAVVFVVSASDPLAFRSRTWTFPVVGSVPYLGWFDRDDARIFADDLRAQGLDVDLRGADAYSTLGWFEDPILSTMLGAGDDALGGLANVVLHESVHATYYVKNQAPLNESVADFLGDKLARAFLIAERGPESVELDAYDLGVRERERKGEELHAARVELEAIYASNATREEKLDQKARVVARVRYEIGLRRPVNNALLAGYAVYHSGRAELDALYAACGESAARVVASLRHLDPASFRRRHDEAIGRALRPLIAQNCPR